LHKPVPSPAAASPTDGDCAGRHQRHRKAATHDRTSPRTARRQRLGTPRTCSLSRSSEPVVGDCDFGRVIDGKLLAQPVWHLLTVSPQAAESIASVLGAEPQRRLANGSEQLEVVAEKASLRVVIENPGRLMAQMKLWDSVASRTTATGVCSSSRKLMQVILAGVRPPWPSAKPGPGTARGRSQSRPFCSAWPDLLTSARSASGLRRGASPRRSRGYALNWPQWAPLHSAISRSERLSSPPKTAAGSATTSPS
jgi:hypothetical protein